MSVFFLIQASLGLKSFNTTRKILKEIEAFHMIKQGQVDSINRCALAEIEFINKLFGLGA